MSESLIDALRRDYEWECRRWSEKYPTTSWHVKPSWHAKNREQREKDRAVLLDMEAQLAALEGRPLPASAVRICNACKVVKRWAEFHIQPNGRPKSECRECARARAAKWYRENRRKRV